jgi:hypothetical protein
MLRRNELVSVVAKLLHEQHNDERQSRMFEHENNAKEIVKVVLAHIGRC